MGHVEFGGRRGASLNVTYTDLEDKDEVGFEVITEHGDLAVTLSGKTVDELHSSLGAWLERRKIDRANKVFVRRNARAAARSKKPPP